MEPVTSSLLVDMLRRFLIFLKPRFLYYRQIKRVADSSDHRFNNIRVSEILETMKKNHKITHYNVSYSNVDLIENKYKIFNKTTTEHLFTILEVIFIIMFFCWMIIMLNLLLNAISEV